MKRLFTIFFMLAAFSEAGLAQTCDTLFNLVSPHDTPVYYQLSGGCQGCITGYIEGNNYAGPFAQLGLAEGFASIPGDSITSAIFYFSVCIVNSADSNNTVTFYVWDNSDTSEWGIPGAPGKAIDSATLTFGQIVQEVTLEQNTQQLQGIAVNFPHVALTTDTFYVGVMLPTKTGDTLALFNNTSPGPDGDAWDLTIDTTTGWSSMIDNWYNFHTDTAIGLFIEAILCSAPSGIITTDNNNITRVYPNPAGDVININCTNLSPNTNYTIFDLLGNQVLSGPVTSNFTTVHINALAAGAYLLRVADNQQQGQSFKLIKTK